MISIWHLIGAAAILVILRMLISYKNYNQNHRHHRHQSLDDFDLSDMFTDLYYDNRRTKD